MATTTDAGETRPSRRQRRETLIALTAEKLPRYVGKADHALVPSSGGALIHTRITGDPSAPPVVLAHGWSCQIDNFPAQVPHLVDAGYRVIEYDQRGHGQSSRGNIRFSTDVLADDLEAVLTHTLRDDEKALLVGHSMGGVTIMAWADRYPGSVQRCAHHAVLHATLADQVAEEVVRRNLPVIGFVADRYPSAVRKVARFLFARPITPDVARNIVKLIALSPSASPESVQYTLDLVRSAPMDVKARWGRTLIEMDVRGGLDKLTVPTSVIYGTQDRLIPPPHSERLAARLRANGHLDRFVAMKGRGHMCHLEDPERFNEFLDSVLGEQLAPPKQVAG